MAGPTDNKRKSMVSGWLVRWFKICALLLVALIVLKAIGVEIIVQIDYDGEAILAALTEIETYYIPLALLLAYFVTSWLWDAFFKSRDD